MIMIKTPRGWRPISSVAANHNDCEGVFRPATYGEARAETMRRANDYQRDVHRYLRGEIKKEEIHRTFNVPCFGAFGEKL